jgi:hypothetical protein
MLKRTDVKSVAIVVVGVMLAGYAMYQFRDINTVNEARAGFGG